MKRSLALSLTLLLCSMFTACERPNFMARTEVARFARMHVTDDHVLIVADVHLDPFEHKELVDQLAQAPAADWEAILKSVGGRTSSYGHDANAVLWLSSLQAMKAAVPNPAYVLLAGDLLAHDFHNRFTWTATETGDAAFHSFVDKTADFITYELTKTYPHTQIFPTIGNNDGYCGDYVGTPHDAYLAHQAAVWTPIIDPQHRFPDIETTFARGGYYRAQSASGVRIVSLNTVFLSKNYTNKCGLITDHPGDDEMAWLRGVLPDTHASPTLVLTHIPVGIDGFKTFFHLGVPAPLLLEKFQIAFIDLVNSAQSHVTAIITGHLHDVGYRQTHAGAADNRPVLIVPSISPIFGNSPAFMIASISKTGEIDDFEVHRLQPDTTGRTTWNHVVDFNERYHLQGVNVASIAAIHKAEGSDERARTMLQTDSVGSAPALAVTVLDWKSLWCTNGALTTDAFLRCEHDAGAPSAPPPHP